MGHDVIEQRLEPTDSFRVGLGRDMRRVLSRVVIIDISWRLWLMEAMSAKLRVRAGRSGAIRIVEIGIDLVSIAVYLIIWLAIVEVPGLTITGRLVVAAVWCHVPLIAIMVLISTHSPSTSITVLSGGKRGGKEKREESNGRQCPWREFHA